MILTILVNVVFIIVTILLFKKFVIDGFSIDIRSGIDGLLAFLFLEIFFIMLLFAYISVGLHVATNSFNYYTRVVAKGWTTTTDIEEYSSYSGEWTLVDAVEISGVNTEPYWLLGSPGVWEEGIYTNNKTNPSEGDLYAGHGEVKYYVRISGDDNWYQVYEQEWERFSVGSRVRHEIIEDYVPGDPLPPKSEIINAGEHSVYNLHLFRTDDVNLDPSDTEQNDTEQNNTELVKKGIIGLGAFVVVLIVLNAFWKTRNRMRYSRYSKTDKKNCQTGSGADNKVSRIETVNKATIDFFKGCTTWEHVEERYKSLMNTYHPDMDSGDEEYSREINEQYRVQKSKYGK